LLAVLEASLDNTRLEDAEVERSVDDWDKLLLEDVFVTADCVPLLVALTEEVLIVLATVNCDVPVFEDEALYPELRELERDCGTREDVYVPLLEPSPAEVAVRFNAGGLVTPEEPAKVPKTVDGDAETDMLSDFALEGLKPST